MNYLRAIKLPGVLKSKRFLNALTGCIVALIVIIEPNLEAHAPQLLTLIGGLFGVSGVSYGVADAFVAYKSGEEKAKFL